MRKTPEGVPDDANYLRPDEDAPEGYSVVEGPGGGRYAVRGGESEDEGSQTPDNRPDIDVPEGTEFVDTEYGAVPDTEGPIPPDMRSAEIGADVHPVLWKRPDDEEELDEYISEIQDTDWFGEGSEIFEKAWDGDENTENYHTDEDGNWDEERLQKHDEWTDELLNEDATTDADEEPIGMVLLGPPGAGKGWWQEQADEGEFGETGEFTEREFTAISSDRTKEPIPEYNQTNAAEVHDEASKMAKDELAPKVTENEQNAVIDKVATSPDSTIRMVEAMQEQGYDIRASFVDVPTEKAVHNAVSRFFEEGRFTPLDFVKGAVEDSRSSFDEIVDQMDIPEEKVGRFDNDVEWGDPPDVEDMGEDLLKFYRDFFGWEFTRTYKSIEVQVPYGDKNGRKTTRRRQRERDNGVDGAGLRREVSRGNGRSGGKRVADATFDSPIEGERLLSRVSTDALTPSETDEKRIEVVNVRQTPDDKLAKSDGSDGLYYLSKQNRVPSRWQTFADRVSDPVLEQSDDVVDRLTRAYKSQVWPDDLSKAPRTWDEDDAVEGTLKDWVDTVIERMDPLHDQYSGVPALASLTVQKVIRRSLTQPQGWSVNSVAKNLRDEFDWMDQKQSESIARQEVAAVLNTAKSVMLRAAEKEDEQYLYDWVGPDDAHTSKICEDIKKELERRGGEVPLAVLEDVLYDVAKEYDGKGGTPHRVEELIPHFGCRHTLERVA